MSRGFKLAVTYTIYIGLVVVVFFTALQWFKPEESNAGNEKTGSVLEPDKKYIIITMDDGWSSQYEAYQRLKPYKGTLYICSGLIGKEDRLSLEQLKEMYENGWDICNHTVHHVNLTKVSLEKARDEIYGCSSWIAGQGFTRDMGYKHFAYPEGAYNEEILDLLKDLRMLSARTTNSGNSTADVLQLGRSSLWGMTRQNIRQLINSEQKLIILSLHRIVPDDTAELKEIDLKSSYLDEIIAAIKESGREVITITEWYKMKG